MRAVHGPEADFYDPRDGDQPVRARGLLLDRGPHEPARTNYFAVYRVDSGSGAVSADDVHCPFGPGSLLFFLPYQYVRVSAEEAVRGEVIEFHANFLCVETFHTEVGCSGALFNDPYGVPVLPLGGQTLVEVADLFGRIRRELDGLGLAHREAALAYLKVLLILATRSKAAAGSSCGAGAEHRHPVLGRLTTLIEQNYRTWHAPAQYADALHMTAKTLGRLVREQLGTTLTDLIRRRVLTHAKWQLLHTLRPIKEIALEVGFNDELYFSRMFKKATGVSPTFFRAFETEIRGGSNLSMSSGRPSILRPADVADNPAMEADGRGDAEAGAAEGARRIHGHGHAHGVRAGGTG